MFYIWLFIAPDGDFIHYTPELLDMRMITRVVQVPPKVPVDDPTDLRIETKIYTRYILAIPRDLVNKQHIPTWPCDSWDNFLRGVIKDLENKGDAPWKGP